MKLSAGRLKRLLNLYGPYLGAGVKVTYVAEDVKEIRVSMNLRWYNKNAVGNHFGGSLYAMIDPHLMLMLMKLLGDDYIVWDKSASIDYIRPGTGNVSATIRVDDTTVQAIKDADGEKSTHLPELRIKILDENGKAVCRVKKILYVRKKTSRTKTAKSKNFFTEFNI